MFDELIQLASNASGWAYAVLLLVALADAIVPVVPSETAVIAAGVVAAAGELSLPIVVGSAAVGAIAGDNSAYALGRRYGTGLVGRLGTGDRMRRRLHWAERHLTERGSELIAVGRFIPGGRTAVTLSAGTLRFPWHRFAIADAAAAAAWGLYAALLGFVGGRAFEAAPWKGLLLALALASAAAGVFEVVRSRRRRRSAGLPR
jgi:membrane-associated protein